MLDNYIPIYQLAMRLQGVRTRPELLGFLSRSQDMSDDDRAELHRLLEAIERVCADMGFTYTSNISKRVLSRTLPNTYADANLIVTHLDDSLTEELQKEAVFRISPARKDYFERDDLFGPEVTVAFPSCARDIRKAGSCYALEQEDACVHHLMLTLERGLKALASRVGVTFQHGSWQAIINGVVSRLNATPRDPNRAFYLEVNAQFGFLKDAYRNHSEHSHDDPYDMEKALSILNHVRYFMQELERGGLTE